MTCCQSDNAERVCEVGYINDQLKHVLISVLNPSLCNAQRPTKLVQIAITIDSAITLRAELNAFLKAHGIIEN